MLGDLRGVFCFPASLVWGCSLLKLHTGYFAPHWDWGATRDSRGALCPVVSWRMSHRGSAKLLSCHIFSLGAWGGSSQLHSLLPITYRIPKEPGPPVSVDLGSPGGEGGGLMVVLTILAFIDITELNATRFWFFNLLKGSSVSFVKGVQQYCPPVPFPQSSSSPCPISWFPCCQNSSSPTPAPTWNIILSCFWGILGWGWGRGCFRRNGTLEAWCPSSTRLYLR